MKAELRALLVHVAAQNERRRREQSDAQSDRAGTAPLEERCARQPEQASSRTVHTTNRAWRAGRYTLQARHAVAAGITPEHVLGAFPHQSERFGGAPGDIAKQHGAHPFGLLCLIDE